MKFAFIQAEKANFPVALMCRQLEVSCSGYYAFCQRPESERSKANAVLLDRIKEVYKTSKKRYGSPRIYETLHRPTEP